MLRLKDFGFESVEDLPKFTPPRKPLQPIQRILRTPDERFRNTRTLFPFAPHYITTRVHGLIRIAYIDENPSGKQTILLMHGEPTWSFLYRHMISPLVAAGYRVVVPDLVGFGRSDKPADRP